MGGKTHRIQQQQLPESSSWSSEGAPEGLWTEGRGSGPCLWHQVLVKQCQSELSVLGALKAVIGHISIVLCVLEYSEE